MTNVTASAVAVCVVDGCSAPVRIKMRGLCNRHYHRFRHHGDPLADLKCDWPAERRFWSKVDFRGDCWLWTGSVARRRGGYGQFRLASAGRKRMVKAHRVAYELLVGPIPEGLEPDHLCRNPRCVNPDHLEPVTHHENVLRGMSPSAQGARADHCIHDHPFDEANTYYRPDNGTRQCRTCARERMRRYDRTNRRRVAA